MLKRLRYLSLLLPLCLLAACAQNRADYAANTHMNQVKDLQKQGVQVIETGDQLRVILASDIFFKSHSTELNPQQINTFPWLASVIHQYENLPINVTGYTDNVASAQANIYLSQRQARTIAAYLWAQGIPLDRMHIKGQGDNEAVAANDYIPSSAYNRRIEITINQ
jgi:outer membrane protein OmpA-like peptidoglycan-associated protein